MTKTPKDITSPGKPGRPSIYSDDLADMICDRLANGESLRAICDSPDMPHRSTVLGWQKTIEDFSTKCACARVLQGHSAVDEMIDIERSVETGSIEPDAARVMISSKQWRASKQASKAYGDRVVVAGDPDAPLEMRATLSALDETQLAALKEIAAKLAK
jgi:hypothetical protein